MDDMNIVGDGAEGVEGAEEAKDGCCDGGTCECGGEKSACGCSE